MKILGKLPNELLSFSLGFLDLKNDLHCESVGEAINLIRRFHLTHIDLTPFSRSISNRVLEKFTSFHWVQSFQLNAMNKISHLDFMRDWKQLQVLSLSNSYLLRNIDPLASLKQVRVLHLKSCFEIRDKDMRILGQLPNLEQLSLNNCAKLTKEGVVHLKQYSLKEVHLGGCWRVGDQALRSLSQLPHLNILNLSYCHALTDEGVMQLHNNKALKKLDLTFCEKVTLMVRELLSFNHSLDLKISNPEDLDNTFYESLPRRSPALVRS